MKKSKFLWCLLWVPLFVILGGCGVKVTVKNLNAAAASEIVVVDSKGNIAGNLSGVVLKSGESSVETEVASGLCTITCKLSSPGFTGTETTTQAVSGGLFAPVQEIHIP